MRADSYPHQWGACRCPVILAKEKPGNHFPLLFRGLYTTGNRGTIRTLPEYDRVSNPQDFAAPAKGNGGTFTWGIRILSLMKRLSGRPAESRKPWTRFYGITASESGLLPLKTDTSTRTPRTISNGGLSLPCSSSALIEKGCITGGGICRENSHAYIQRHRRKSG